LLPLLAGDFEGEYLEGAMLLRGKCGGARKSVCRTIGPGTSAPGTRAPGTSAPRYPRNKCENFAKSPEFFGSGQNTARKSFADIYYIRTPENRPRVIASAPTFKNFPKILRKKFWEFFPAV
jgi:hypothetical protein